MYQSLIRPLLFRLKPETAHQLTVALLRVATTLPGVTGLLRKLYAVNDPRLERQLFGLRFANPVGLAAGFDKDARLVDGMAALGFGFVEVGTVTPFAQPGNPKPRIFRLPADRSLINRLGFNNHGVSRAARNLARRRSSVIVGGNIGKNKVTPNDRAPLDYESCFRALYDHVDYFTVNVSSPNTPDLRELQEKEPLTDLLRGLQQLNRQQPHPKPILLKIAPDLSNEQLDDIVAICESLGIDGIIATNTTISRNGLATPDQRVSAAGAGGLSGQALRQRATEVIRYLHRRSGGRLPIIGVGGVASPEDALEKLAAGASLVQIYTGLVYEGPALVKRINRVLAETPAQPVLS
jgi:dihydroorotate dehydrogenase